MKKVEINDLTPSKYIDFKFQKEYEIDDSEYIKKKNLDFVKFSRCKNKQISI